MNRPSKHSTPALRSEASLNSSGGREAHRQVVVLLSTMRSGSTLLKALLAEADDVSNLPEVNFQSFRDPNTARARIEALDERPILVLKRPAWYQETGRYPRLPAVDDVKAIVLVRDVYDTVLSLRKMTFGRFAPLLARWTNRFLVERYWARVNLRLRETLETLGERAHLVRYEDLVRDPIATTDSLFRFVGSSIGHGVDRYQPPEKFQWKWGQDDAGEKITSLRVQEPRASAQQDQRLLTAIRRSEPARRVREWLNYPVAAS